MLPAHNRYDYSMIDRRPDYSWPEGKRLAFYIGTNIEYFAFGTGPGSDPAFGSSAPQTQRNYAWRDYGHRVGIWRLFNLLDELHLPAAHNLTSLICDYRPEIVERIRTRGDEIIGHGRTQSERQGTMWEEDEARMIAESTANVERHAGRRPYGWMGPGMSHSQVTIDREQISAGLVSRVQEGLACPGADYDAAAMHAGECRALIDARFDDFDVLLAPSAIGEAPVGLSSTGKAVFNRTWTLLGLPCVTIPCGRGPAGLPVGVQIIGRFRADKKTLEIATWIERQIRQSS